MSSKGRGSSPAGTSVSSRPTALSPEDAELFNKELNTDFPKAMLRWKAHQLLKVPMVHVDAVAEQAHALFEAVPKRDMSALERAQTPAREIDEIRALIKGAVDTCEILAALA